MYVPSVLRCPDEGEDIVLVSINEDGETRAQGRLQRADIVAARDFVRTALARWREEGWSDDDVAEIRALDSFVQGLRDLDAVPAA